MVFGPCPHRAAVEAPPPAGLVCFACHVAERNRSPALPANVDPAGSPRSPFVGVLTPRQIAHRRVMLAFAREVCR